MNNYRPIALVTVASKIFENVLLDILEPFLYTCDNQFGFKKSHSTDHCIYAMINVIDYYRSYNSSVYSCFLDATKCFDKINHCRFYIVSQINTTRNTAVIGTSTSPREDSAVVNYVALANCM